MEAVYTRFRERARACLHNFTTIHLVPNWRKVVCMFRIPKLTSIGLAGWIGVTATVVQADFPSQFFPAGRFDPYKFRWYTTFLVGLQEPSLIVPSVKSETIRFTWLRSFHSPVVVRVVFGPDGSSEIILKVSSGAGGYEAGDLIRNDKRSLSNDETAAVRNSLSFLNACKDPPERAMFDGAQWIFERKTRNGYCVIDEQSPKVGELRQAGLLLLKLADYHPGDDEIY